MRVGLFVADPLGPFRAQISPRLLVGVGHCLSLFVLVVSLNMSAVTCLEVSKQTRL